MRWTWPCYRLMLEDKATWTEVTEKMSLNDVMRLNDAVNLMHTPPPKQPSNAPIKVNDNTNYTMKVPAHARK